MPKIFDTVRERKPEMSAFDLSHEKKLSAKFGKLYPMLLQEVMPGDHFKGGTEMLVRMAPMIAPIMHRIDVHIHYFCVPNRIVWPQFDELITGGDDGTSTPTPPYAFIEGATQCGKGTLADYFGLPTDETASYSSPANLNALPFRAYHEIWNEYYRDQNLQDKFDITDSADPDFWALRNRAYEKDYFTSALPAPQKGPAVDLPIDNTVFYKGISDVYDSAGTPASDGDVTTHNSGKLAVENAGRASGRIENIDSILSGVNIEQLRVASRLQEFLEIMSRAGSRIKEVMKSMFGVDPGDARLDRPEYIGGGKVPISISEVLNTTGDPSGPVQGDMAGHGIAVGNKAKFSCKVKEYGFIIGIMSILPKTGYQQGIHPLWYRRTRLDYPWPKFANLGEQAVLNSELYQEWGGSGNSDTFGYQQRYADFKFAQNTVHGDMRDDYDFWQLVRKFSTRPNLNEEFITCDNADLQRIFAVTDPTIDKFFIQVYNRVHARRPLPYFSKSQL